LILKVWSSQDFAHRLQSKDVIMVCEEEAYKLTVEEDGSVSSCEIPQLKSDQEETDTRIVLYCN